MDCCQCVGCGNQRGTVAAKRGHFAVFSLHVRFASTHRIRHNLTQSMELCPGASLSFCTPRLSLRICCSRSYTPTLDYDNLVRALHCRRPVRDKHHCHCPSKHLESLNDPLLVFAVQIARGFIQQQQRRMPQRSRWYAKLGDTILISTSGFPWRTGMWKCGIGLNNFPSPLTWGMPETGIVYGVDGIGRTRISVV